MERYTTNFGTGSLCTAMSTSFMLGMLGWIRAMVKLSLGAQMYKNAGFSVASLQPFWAFRRMRRCRETKSRLLHIAVENSEKGCRLDKHAANPAHGR